MPEVEWSALVPTEVREALEPLVRHYQLWPAWMYKLHIQYHPERDTEMSINTNYKYRVATLMATGIWLSMNPADRETALLHEMVHAFWDPCDSTITDMMDSLLEQDSALDKFTRARYQANLEAATQDLALMLYRTLGPARSSV